MKLKYVLKPEIKKLGISSIVVAEVQGISIAESNPELEKIKEQAAATISKMDERDIAENPVLQSYKDLVQKIGRSLKKFEPAAESLIDNIKKKGEFITINTAVDSYNVVATKTFLAFGVHDINKLNRTITFRLSPGQEPFTSVGSESTKYTQQGDFVYADENQVLAWLDSKDSEKVKLSIRSKNIVIIAQGTPYTSKEYKLNAVKEACELITKFCGGIYEIKIIE